MAESDETSMDDTRTSYSPSQENKPACVLILCATILTLLSLGSSSLGAPANRLLESALCARYYNRTDPGQFPPKTEIPEEDCKQPEIQASLAYLLSTLTILTKIAGITIVSRIRW